MRLFVRATCTLLPIIFFALFANAEASPSLILDAPEGPGHAISAVLHSVPQNNELKILWWNIRNGGELGRALQAKAIAAGNPNAVAPHDENIKTIISAASRPEVLILGEFQLGTFTEQTNALLARVYPYQHYFEYSRFRTQAGIQVYSLYPINVNSSLLDWSPFPASADTQKTFKDHWKSGLDPEAEAHYDHVFIEIQVKKANHLWHVIPTHLLNNWIPLADKIGRNKTGLMLLFGTDNPHYFQIKRLMEEKIAPILKASADEHSGVVLLGDFNLPDSLFAFTPIAYRLMQESMTEVPIRDFTFPAVSSDMTAVRQMAIDHAFHDDATQTIQFGRLPLQGSDHYPIEVLFQAPR